MPSKNSIMELTLIDQASPKPKYRQVVENIISSIEKGIIVRGQQLPSINELADEYDLAKATVSKSYDELKERGVIISRHGKGFYISSTQVRNKLNVFILFDTLNAYKEILYKALQTSFPEDTHINIYFHHYDKELFRSLIENNLGNFNYYVVMPHFDDDVSDIIKKIPRDKLLIIDKDIDSLDKGYASVFQDFENDVYQALHEAAGLLRKYSKLNVIMGKSHFQYIPQGLIQGIRRFSRETKMPFGLIDRFAESKICKGEAYLLFSDNDLIRFVKHITANNWQAGKHIGLISYDDTPLKEILLNGVTVITTDFEAMGTTAARMITERIVDKIRNPSKLIIRKTL